MKLPHISISFSSGSTDKAQYPLERSTGEPSNEGGTLGSDIHAILPRAVAIQRVLESSALTPEEILAAQDHVRCIQYAWKEFQTNLDQDRLVLQLARRVQLLEQMQELEARQTTAAAQIRSTMDASHSAEVQA